MHKPPSVQPKFVLPPFRGADFRSQSLLRCDPVGSTPESGREWPIPLESSSSSRKFLLETHKMTRKACSAGIRLLVNCGPQFVDHNWKYGIHTIDWWADLWIQTWNSQWQIRKSQKILAQFKLSVSNAQTMNEQRELCRTLFSVVREVRCIQKEGTMNWKSKANLLSEQI